MAITANPADIERSLRGISFPASKDELIRHARDNDAEMDVLDALRSIPEGRYNSSAEITQALVDFI
jgi:hypothetical protein